MPYINIIYCAYFEKHDLAYGSAKFISSWAMNFQIFKLDLEKAEEPEIKLPTAAGPLKKQESSRKTSALLSTPKPLYESQQTVEYS